MENSIHLKPLTASELKLYNGGGWPAVAAVYGAILAGAYYLGYYNGKRDCEDE